MVPQNCAQFQLSVPTLAPQPVPAPFQWPQLPT